MSINMITSQLSHKNIRCKIMRKQHPGNNSLNRCTNTNSLIKNKQT